MIIKQRAYARAGLIGNPSDGYNGKTISIILKNFRSIVTLYESPYLEILPSPQDHSKFEDLRGLVEDVQLHGYYGGVRLIRAAVRKFYDYCVRNKLPLADKNFTITYESNIPRQVGLGGSSAIITATVRALMTFYDVEVPQPVLANLILSVETEELGISAGLQDRVIQVYGGMVYMDFDKVTMEKQAYGNYIPLDPSLLPPLFIAYRTDLSEISKVFHDNVKQRYQDGDTAVVDAMKDFAGYAAQAKEALLANRRDELGSLMDANFDRRASIYRISEKNLDMVGRGRELKACVKFAGSGGAVIGTYENQEMFEELERTYAEAGCNLIKPVIV